MLILLASILFYVLIMALVQKRRRQAKAHAMAIAKHRQQRIHQQQYNRF